MDDDVIEAIKRSRDASRALEPKSPAASLSGKIERIRFALSRFDMPFTCTNVEMHLIDRKEDCDDCAAAFLATARDVMDGKGLPGE